ncbi:hypothetical protein RHSIM_Rhsim02G0053400 [Rhododendron simsii]|uniref:Uncharacterized protein n=1 Tax=Rhododendron simsii TaxID=118357 RepID=A0A834HBC9_RHOSS|nr:hypothetical protein RHSIM_Rhsim02G0053400 [Rhododendron simsii]
MVSVQTASLGRSQCPYTSSEDNKNPPHSTVADSAETRQRPSAAEPPSWRSSSREELLSTLRWQEAVKIEEVMVGKRRRWYEVIRSRGVNAHAVPIPAVREREREREICRDMERAIERQRVVLQHLRPSSTSSSLENIQSSLNASVCAAGDSAAYHRSSVYGDDVVIVAAYRTALCKSKRGGFKDTYPDDLLAPVLKAVIEKTNVNPSEVGDIVVGTVLAPGSQRASECRMAAFYAGFPETVPVRTVNRQCSSGLQAVADVAASIKAGFYDIGIGAGLESMTANPMAWEGSVNPRVKTMAQAQDCLLPMGVTSENVAHRFSVTRQEQDQAAVESHRKAAAATASGKFKEEIIPVATKIVDPKTGDEKPVTISVDDGIRPNASLSDLGKLKPVFKKDGTTTAGNSSQVSDGAGAVLLMKRSVATQKGLPILGVFRCVNFDYAAWITSRIRWLSYAHWAESLFSHVHSYSYSSYSNLSTLISSRNLDEGFMSWKNFVAIDKILIRRYVSLILMGDAIFLAVNIISSALNLIRTFAAVGVDPAIMGVGPAAAIPAAVKAAGLELDDIDLFEINEFLNLISATVPIVMLFPQAFASQFVYCRKKLDLDPEKINVNGGAMAIGHPLGATGARCVATLLHEMKRRGKDCRFGVISMCIGTLSLSLSFSLAEHKMILCTGMGAAAVFERGDSVDELCNARKIETNNLLSKDAR